MRSWLYVVLGLVAFGLVYVSAVLVFGFMPIGIAINFARVALAVAVLVMYVPLVVYMFQTIPRARRDYLIAGILFTWTSAICFAVWNEAGHQFGVNTSIFASPVAGFFSLLLVIGGVFTVIAPDVADSRRKWIALASGIIAGSLITIARFVL